LGAGALTGLAFFPVLPSPPGFLFFNVITRRCPFLSLPDFFFIYVIARLDRAICLSPPSDFPDTPVKPEYDNNKRHHPPGPFLPLPGLLFFMSLFGFLFYVIARLDRAICLSPPSDFPDTPVKPEYDNKKTSLPGLTGQSGCLSHNRPS